MEYVYWIVIGMLAGFLAKVQFPAKKDENIFSLLVVGSLGGLLGGWIMNAARGGSGVMSMIMWTYVVAFVGAAVLLFIQRTVMSQQPARTH